MLHDIVVDTNVLVHASNPAVALHEAALLFVTALTTSKSMLCVDEGFDIREANNRSLIASEYRQHLIVGMVGYSVIVALASSGRVKQVAKAVNAATRNRVRKLVPRKPRDRTFIHVAINSTEHVVVSHDFDDFSADVRRQLQRDIGVHVIDAGESVALLE